MYKDLRLVYWWSGLKKVVGKFVAQCLTCQQVKAEHQLPAGRLQSLAILVWKWERITLDKVRLGREWLILAQSRQKSYANKRRRDLEFLVGDHVFLKVLPMWGVKRFVLRWKLSSRFIGPLEILECKGPVANRLALSPNLSRVHYMFHVSMLRKYVFDPSHVVDFAPLELCEDLSFEELPVRNMACEVRKLRNREIPFVKVLWSNHL